MAIFEPETKKFLCECGCGCECNPFRQFRPGHNHRYNSIEEALAFSDKMSIAMTGVNTGHLHSQETKDKISEAQKEVWASLSLEDRFKRSMADAESLRGSTQSLETRQARSVAMKGLIRSKENRENLSKAKGLAWTNPEFKDKMIKALLSGSLKRPNRLELAFRDLLDLFFPEEWIYTGNGSLVIGGLNPDFCHRTKKKVIEVFGLYWHGPEITDKTEDQRISKLKSLGYDCLVVWENEVGRLDILDQIYAFSIL